MTKSKISRLKLRSLSAAACGYRLTLQAYWKRGYLRRLIVWLAIVGLLLQPIVPAPNAPSAYADDEFEPWCGSDCEDPNGDDDGNGHCGEDDTSCNNDCSAKGGSAINFFTGEESFTEVDLALPGFFPFILARTYRSQSPINHRYGFGWDLNVNLRLQRQSDGDVVLSNGSCGRHIFERKNGRYTSPPGLFLTLTEQTNGSYELRAQDGSTQVFDRDGKIVIIKDRFDNQIRFAYNPQGRLPIIGASNVFRTGRRSVVGYDYQLATATDTAGRTISFGYNTDGRLSTITYGGNRHIQYRYDTNDNLIEVIDEVGQHRQYQYKDSRDPHNLTATINDEGQVVAERTYDTKDRVFSETVDGHRASVSYTTKSGRVSEAVYTNGGGDRTTYQFDTKGNTTQVRTHSATGSKNDILTSLGYNNKNQMTFAKVAQANEVPNHTINYTYDSNGRLTDTSSSSGLRVKVQPDAANFFQPKSITNPTGGVSGLSYDTNSNLDTNFNPRGNMYKFDWSRSGLLVETSDPLDHTAHYQYDADGNLTIITDALQLETRLDYDALGQLSRIRDTLGNAVNFSNDRLGQLAVITDSLNYTYTLDYDSTGNLTSYTNPRGYTTRLAYSAASNPISITNALNQTTKFGYDGANNLISKTDGNKIVTNYSYDMRGNLTGVRRGNQTSHSYQHNFLSDLVKADTPRLHLGFDYRNGLPGQPSEVQFQGRASNPITATVRYDYLMPGASVGQGDRWRSGLAYGVELRNGSQLALSVGYDYDAEGNLTELASNGLATYHYRFDYDAASRLSSLGPIAGSNGISTTIVYDVASRIERWINTTPDRRRVFQNYQHEYDLVGNLTVLTDTVTSEVTRYTYDRGYQLESTQLPNGTQLRYVYDGAGNRTIAATNGVSVTYQYNATNQLFASSARGGTAYAYDDNGNLRARTDNRGSTRYFWNSEDELIRVELPDSTSVAYEYDALGRRSSRTDRSGKTTYYVYDSENLVQELDQTGAVKAVYVHSQILDHPLSMNRNGITYYYLYDRLGSVVGLADAAGTLVAKYVYDAWGNIVGGFDGGIENPFRFTAREWDPEVKLYYYRSRYYDPEVGRFIQQDKLGLTGGLNLYVYTGNNPINSIDPFGFDWEDWGEGWLPQVGDFFNGFADALTFGLVGQLHKLTGTSQFVNKCSGSYNAGEWAGIGLSLAFSVAHLGRNAAYQGAKRVISDPRKWGTVRSAWSKAAGGLRPKGQSLHHWLIPQRWAKVNAGFNYLPLTARFNSWMNGSTALRVAVEWGFRGTVLGIYGAPVTVAARR